MFACKNNANNFDVAVPPRIVSEIFETKLNIFTTGVVDFEYDIGMSVRFE